MHITQRNIILKLMYADKLRYSEVKPKQMTGNQFKYHLDALITRGLIEKKQDHYQLTSEGKIYVEQISQSNGTRTKQPRTIGQVIIRDKEGNILLHKQERQPFPQTWNLPYAKVRFGQSPLATAARICARFGIVKPEFEFRCSAYIFHRHKGVPVSARLTHVFELRGEQSVLPIVDKTEWFNLHKLPSNLSPGTLELIANYEMGSDIQAYIEVDC